jgi:putative addiction module CopG family antidote
MATLNVSMPDELRAFIEARVNTGEYQSASDYLRDLIRHNPEAADRTYEAAEKTFETLAAMLEIGTVN